MIEHIAFTGHRNVLADPADLHAIYVEFPRTTWIHGGAIGFDQQVDLFAKAHKVITQVIRPEYEKYGRAAPLKRNDQIVDAGDILIACWDGRRTGGTWYTICYARKKGKDVRFIRPVLP